MFQQYGTELTSQVLVSSLFLGFCGFFLLILLLSIVIISQSEVEDILIDIEDEKDDDQDDMECCEKEVQVIRQKEQILYRFLYKIKNILFTSSELIFEVIQIPVKLYFHIVHYISEINNDFISIK